MHIVLEGHDSSGKSTLAAFLGQRYKMPIQMSEGPPKGPGEINERIRRYLDIITPTIFDRHPAVSQPIYGTAVRATAYDPASPSLIAAFYETKPLFIYCRPLGFTQHVAKQHDSPEHLKGVADNYHVILELYERWAVQHANLMYQAPDLSLILGAIDHLFDPYDPIRDIQAFHNKFGLAYEGPPRFLPEDLFNFRRKFLQEEVDEWEDAGDEENLAQQLDALVDLQYILLGTAYLQGFTKFKEAWRRVHAANMTKVKSQSQDHSDATSGRVGFQFDIVKPPGWTAPVLTDLVDA